MRLALLALVALAPIASAQAAEPFGFTDATLDAFPPAMNAYADLVSGEMVRVDEATLRATLVVSFLPATQPGVGYGFLFTADGTEWYVALVHAQELVYFYGRWEEGPVSTSDTTGSFTTGPQATIVMDFPLHAIPEAWEIGTPRGIVADFKGELLPTGGPLVTHDEAIGEGTLVLRTAAADAPEPAEEEDRLGTTSVAPDPIEPTTLSPQPSRETPFPSALVALGLALALALRRRSR